MKPKTLAIREAIPVGLLTILATLNLAGSVRAENSEQTQQLLASKQCPRCDLSNAGLVFAKLTNANLSQANLSGANLSRADLQGADLRGANLTGATLFGANLVGAKLDGATLIGTDLRNTYLAGASLKQAVMEGVLLQGSVGLSTSVGTADDFYRWAVGDTEQKNYARAIENYSHAIERDPTLAHAYLGRSVALYQVGNREGAIADMEHAQSLFSAQGDKKNAEYAQSVVKQLKTPPETVEGGARGGGGGNFGQALLGLVGGLLKVFLRF